MMSNLPPRRRSGGPSWTEPIISRLTPKVKVYVVASTLIYLFYVMVPAARSFMETHLALGPRLFSGEVWQPVTALFFYSDFLGFLLNTIGIWFMGPLLERVQGTRSATALFFVSGIAANLAEIGVSRGSAMVMSGSSNALLALFVAYGRIFGRTETQVIGGLFLQARTLAIVFVVWAVVACLVQGNIPALTGVLTTTAIGYAAGKPGGFADVWQAMKARRARRRYRVLEGGASRKKKYLN